MHMHMYSKLTKRTRIYKRTYKYIIHTYIHTYIHTAGRRPDRRGRCACVEAHQGADRREEARGRNTCQDLTCVCVVLTWHHPRSVAALYFSRCFHIKQCTMLHTDICHAPLRIFILHTFCRNREKIVVDKTQNQNASIMYTLLNQHARICMYICEIK
jgi:hypothetical protein